MLTDYQDFLSICTNNNQFFYTSLQILIMNFWVVITWMVAILFQIAYGEMVENENANFETFKLSDEEKDFLFDHLASKRLLLNGQGQQQQ